MNQLVSPSELSETLKIDRTTAIIDTSDVEIFVSGHIPAAVNIRDFWDFRCLEHRGGLAQLREHFIAQFLGHGLRGVEKLVFTEDSPANGFGQSCRALFMSECLGYRREQLFVLDGGNAAWLRQGLPIEKGLSLKPPAAQFLPQTDGGNSFVDKDFAIQALGRGAKFLDVRNEEEFYALTGAPYDVVEGDPPQQVTIAPGRIPNSLGLPWYDVFEMEGIEVDRFKSLDKLKSIFHQAGLLPEDAIIVYCFKGARASSTLFALQLAGYHNASLYFAGWNEWARDPNLPRELNRPLASQCRGSLLSNGLFGPIDRDDLERSNP